MFFGTALIAVIFEALAGYPDAVFRAIGHPVTWLGRLIAWCDRTWNSDCDSHEARRAWGVATVVLLLAASFLVGKVLMAVLPAILCGVLASCLLAQRSLHQHVEAVATALERDGLDAARQAVSMIVGRDTAELDEAAVSRAAIESLAENFSDGVVAPLFWTAVGSLPGGIAYKAINTADSMIGHKSPRHLAFGWAAARLDDVLNLPASRLSLLWFSAAAMVTPGASPQGAWQAAWRDAGHHDSPNAGWPEAAMAGALGLKLAGPRLYDGDLTDDHWMGDGRAELTTADIRRALSLYRNACGLQIAVLAILYALSF